MVCNTEVKNGGAEESSTLMKPKKGGYMNKKTDFALIWLRVMLILCLIGAVYMIIPWMRDYVNIHRMHSISSEYKRYVKQLNKDISNGIYYPRINDEVFVYEQKSFYYIDVCGHSIYMQPDSEFSEVILLDTENQQVIKGCIKTNLIRPVHSNWDLTQDVWALDERVSKIEKKGKCQINDNPKKK